MKTLRVLIVDDNKKWAKPFQENLSKIPPNELVGDHYQQYSFSSAVNQYEADLAVTAAGLDGFDLVFLDLHYPVNPEDPPVEELEDTEDEHVEFQGMKWLPKVRGLLPSATIVILTAYPKSSFVQNIVAAIRDYDANDFIPNTAPFQAEVVPRIRVAYDTAQR